MRAVANRSKQPGFSFIAIVTFSLGIGATAAVLGVNRGSLSNAVAAGAPADQPQNQNTPTSAGDFEIQKLSEGVYAAIRKQPPLFSFADGRFDAKADFVWRLCQWRGRRGGVS